jgi:hypothetical protein
MNWLLAIGNAFDDWVHARGERAKLVRVEEELRIRRQLDYLEQQRNAAQAGKIITVSPSELMGQSIADLNRRC